MKRKEALEILEQYQKWRLGKCDETLYVPKQITEALNFAIDYMSPKLKAGQKFG